MLLLTFASDDEIDEAVYRNQLAVRGSVLDDGASQPSIEESRERTLSD